MKGKNPKITLIGSNSGNNVGDAAIMSSILESFSQSLPNAEFYVPSTKPSFTEKHYGKKYRAHGVNVMPWTGSIRLLGIPTMWCLAKSDIALICDGIIFGKKLFNPIFNFLITLIFIVPWARLCGCKVICYSCGIGPFPVPLSKTFARWVLNACDLVIMRENDSKRLAEEIGVTKPIQVTGDAAFINPVSSAQRGNDILRENNVPRDLPLFGINVTKYMDTWLKNTERLEDKQSFMQLLADGVLDANQRLGNAFRPIVFCTQHMDDSTCQDLADKLKAQVIRNSRYLSHDVQAVMAHCDLFMGMRFHSVILASAVETPIIGLIYAPKVKGFMRLLNCEDLSLELAELTPEGLSATLVQSWNNRQQIKQKQKAVIDELKEGARRATHLVCERYFPVEEISRESSYTRVAQNS